MERLVERTRRIFVAAAIEAAKVRRHPQQKNAVYLYADSRAQDAIFCVA